MVRLNRRGRSATQRITARTLPVVVLLTAALTVGAAPASADKLTVDDDGSECPSADHTSIQAAVDDPRATPGSTIVVCPGRYSEAVTVATPGLELKTKGGDQGARGRCFDQHSEAPDAGRDAIVEGAPYSFSLEADDVAVSGFVIQGADYGVVTDPSFSGYEIRHNVVQDSARAGINFRSSGGEESVVRENCLRRNERGTESENPGTLRNARIEGNSTFRNKRMGIGATGVPGERASLRIEHNVSRSDGLEFLLFSAAIMISNSENSRIAHNRSLASSRGTWVAGGNVGLEVVHNRVHQSVANGILINARASEPRVVNVGLDVSFNEIQDSAASGLVVSFASAADSFFSTNRLRNNARDGIFFAGNRGNRLEHNDVVGNGGDGIRSLFGASGNVFVENRLSDNTEHDGHDDNRLGNQWVNTRCRTDFPSGTICERGDDHRADG